MSSTSSSRQTELVARYRPAMRDRQCSRRLIATEIASVVRSNARLRSASASIGNELVLGLLGAPRACLAVDVHRTRPESGGPTRAGARCTRAGCSPSS